MPNPKEARGPTSTDADIAARGRNAAIGVACGAGAALFWAAGLVAARHGVLAGLTAWDIAFHRFVWAGLFFLPFVIRRGLAELDGIGWRRGTLLALTGGPPLGLFSYAGFLLVPLGHGGVIQPSCAALGGLLLATLVLHERLPLQRALGAASIVLGLLVIGGEALATIGAHGLLGDLSFVAAGFCFATFGMLLRYWRIDPIRAVDVVSVISLALIPIQWAVAGFGHMIAAGFAENALQFAVQGVLAGPISTYLFARSVILLGAGRAALFPSLVPSFTLLIGYLVLHDVPTLLQLAGMLIVLVGFRLTQRA